MKVVFFFFVESHRPWVWAPCFQWCISSFNWKLLCFSKTTLRPGSISGCGGRSPLIFSWCQGGCFGQQWRLWAWRRGRRRDWKQSRPQKEKQKEKRFISFFQDFNIKYAALKATGLEFIFCVFSENSENEDGGDYPVDIWLLLASYIRPEDVCKFALICKNAWIVTCTAAFWTRLYRRWSHTPVICMLPFSFFFFAVLC